MNTAAVPVRDFSDRFTVLTTENAIQFAAIRVIIPPGPERLWPAIRDIGARGPFTAHDIAASISAGLSSVESYLERLHASAIVAMAGHTTTRRRLWMVTSRKIATPYPDLKGKTSHVHEVTSRIWRALRMGKNMTFTGLCAALDDAEFVVPRETARLYLNALARAGYLTVVSGERLASENRYTLVPGMAQGPLPPRLLRATMVFDPNVQAIAGGSLTAEEVRL